MKDYFFDLVIDNFKKDFIKYKYSDNDEIIQVFKLLKPILFKNLNNSDKVFKIIYILDKVILNSIKNPKQDSLYEKNYYHYEIFLKNLKDKNRIKNHFLIITYYDFILNWLYFCNNNDHIDLFFKYNMMCLMIKMKAYKKFIKKELYDKTIEIFI